MTKSDKNWMKFFVWPVLVCFGILLCWANPENRMLYVYLGIIAFCTLAWGLTAWHNHRIDHNEMNGSSGSLAGFFLGVFICIILWVVVNGYHHFFTAPRITLNTDRSAWQQYAIDNDCNVIEIKNTDTCWVCKDNIKRWGLNGHPPMSFANVRAVVSKSGKRYTVYPTKQ